MRRRSSQCSCSGAAGQRRYYQRIRAREQASAYSVRRRAATVDVASEYAVGELCGAIAIDFPARGAGDIALRLDVRPHLHRAGGQLIHCEIVDLGVVNSQVLDLGTANRSVSNPRLLDIRTRRDGDAVDNRRRVDLEKRRGSGDTVRIRQHINQIIRVLAGSAVRPRSAVERAFSTERVDEADPVILGCSGADLVAKYVCASRTNQRLGSEVVSVGSPYLGIRMAKVVGWSPLQKYNGERTGGC